MSGESKEEATSALSEVWPSERVGHWQQGSEQRKQVMAAATQSMFDAAGLKPGDRVLDLAAGAGEQSRLAAQRVGPGGSVLITDLSPEMLAMAEQVALQEGLTNISTRVMNAEQLDLEDESFDAVICRYGLMVMPHLQQVLSEIRRVLKPGGKFAALVWSRPEKNPLFRLFAAASARQTNDAAPRPPDAAPRPPTLFSLASPEVFERELTNAGFREVMVRAVAFQFHPSSLDAFQKASEKEIAPITQADRQQQQQVEEAKQTLRRQFEGPQGLVLPGEALLGAGTK